MEMVRPLTLSILSRSISGKMICSRMPERVVAAAVERAVGDALEVAHARQRDVHQRSKNSYMRSPRSVTMQPIGMFSRSLKLAMAFFDG